MMLLTSFLEFIGASTIPNPFQDTADFFRDMKVEIDDFENDFDDFGTFMERQGKRVKGF